jgi:hypothetical protein
MVADGEPGCDPVDVVLETALSPGQAGRGGDSEGTSLRLPLAVDRTGEVQLCG